MLPFVYQDIIPLLLNTKALSLLVLLGIIVTIASYIDFEALRIGKLSIVEPIYAFEIAVTASFAALVFGEVLSLYQGILIVLIFIGIFFISTSSFSSLKTITWEKGIGLAIIATIGMGITNFLYGAGARITDPLLLNWFASTFIACICGIALIIRSEVQTMISDLKTHHRLLFGVCVSDIVAWVAFSYATLSIPIAVATSISESYIVIAVLLGLKINKERLKKHQVFGLILVIAAAIVLASITKEL